MHAELKLPSREGERPRITSGIPQIQLNLTASDEMLAELSAWVFSLDGVMERPSRASLPGARALTVAPELLASSRAMIVGREFAHIHVHPNGGGSLHVRLPGEKAQEVVEKGWGEWHPLAVDGALPGLVMVYAPQSEEDLGTVKAIVAAAVAYSVAAPRP